MAIEPDERTADSLRDEPMFIAQRRGIPFRQRLRMRDSYGILLVLVVASIICTGIGGPRSWVRIVPILVQGVTLLFAQKTSGASKKLMLPTIFFIASALVAQLVASASGMPRGVAGVSAAIGALLVLSTIVVVVLRLLKHPVISGETILGAVCVYLLVGLFFAYLYATIGYFNGGKFFAAQQSAVPANFLYFSYVTLTTVGYGDYVAAPRIGQLSAVCEALMGQIYLVTVVALLVGRVGARRVRRDRPNDGPPGAT